MDTRRRRKQLEDGGFWGVLTVGAFLLFHSRRMPAKWLLLPGVPLLLLLIFLVACHRGELPSGPDAAPSPPLALVSQYQITDLGDIYPKDINQQGLITGYGCGQGHEALLWRDGTLVKLEQQGSQSGTATGISDSGKIVGTLSSTDFVGFCLMEQAVIFHQDGNPQTLEPGPEYEVSSAHGVNRNGEVVGYSYPSDELDTRDTKENPCHAVRWDANGNAEDLGRFCGNVPCSAQAINDRGSVAGKWGDNFGLYTGRACLWRRGEFVDIGALPGDTDSVAYAINNADDVVGASNTSGGGNLAFLWRGGRLMSLGSLEAGGESCAFSINDRGQIVGSSAGRAVLWQDGKLWDLNQWIQEDSGWLLQAAVAVNEKGQIVGEGTFGGRHRGFLLTPK
ncbi:MAG: hypothetical protein H7Z41_00350 [Cytophagales bacterium]|nr:hypothetical protein [Armatimonadota bacterium]